MDAKPPPPEDDKRPDGAPPEGDAAPAPGSSPPPSLDKPPPPRPGDAGAAGPPPGGWVGRPPVDRKQIRPNLWWLFLPGSLLVLGIVIGVVAFVIGIAAALSSLTEDLTEFRAPGSATVQIDDGEDYTIYVEDVEDVGRARSDVLNAVDCLAVGDSTGALVTPSFRDRSLSTILDAELDLGRNYLAVAGFTAPETDSYQITCRSTSTVPHNVAVGPSIDFAGFFLGTGSSSSPRAPSTTAIGSVAFPALGLLLAIIALIVILVRRSRSRERLEQAAAGGGSGGLPA